MQIERQKYYPTTIEAIHLLVLYIFIQALIEFPIALYDYQNGTLLLSDSIIGFVINMGITAFILIYGFKKAKMPFKEVFAVKFFNPLLLIPVLLILPALQYLIGFINIEIDKILPPPPWFWELFDRIFENRFGFWGVIFKVVILAPIIEEILFRGIIMNGLMRNYRSWYAIFLSGLLFSLFHLNPWQLSYTLFLGFFLGWIMVKTKSLPLCILAHAINNSIVFFMMQNDKLGGKPFLQDYSTTSKILMSFAIITISIALFYYINSFKKKQETLTKNSSS